MKNLPSRVCQVFPDRLKGPLQVNKQEERQGKNIESAEMFKNTAISTSVQLFKGLQLIKFIF